MPSNFTARDDGRANQIMKANLQRLALLLILAIVAVLVLETVAMACPSCKESLAHSDPARANMVRGYFWSILFMMSMPFVILGGLSALFWWEVRKAKMQKLRESKNKFAVESPAVIEEREPVEV